MSISRRYQLSLIFELNNSVLAAASRLHIHTAPAQTAAGWNIAAVSNRLTVTNLYLTGMCERETVH